MYGLRFLGEKRTKFIEIPKPVAHDQEVLVKIKASALCGTDFPFYRNDKDILGCIPGHEAAGVVVEVDRPINIKVGDRVILNTQVGCGTCEYCRRGQVLFCESMKTMGVTPGFNGVHAEYVSIPEKDCLILPDDIGFDVGAVIPDGVGVPYTIITKMGVNIWDTIAIFGCGPIGLGTILLLKFWRSKVFAVDINPYRIELAKKIGADKVINAKEEDPVKTIKKLTGDMGVNKAIDCAGATNITINQALDSVINGGMVAFIGEKEQVSIQSIKDQIIHRELTIIGSCGYNISNYFKLISIVKEGLPIDKLITHRYPFEKAGEAYKMFDKGETGKIVLLQD